MYHAGMKNEHIKVDVKPLITTTPVMKTIIVLTTGLEIEVAVPKTDRIYGATLGAEYAFLENFSIGFEIQYNYYEINPWTDFGYEEVTLQRAVETVFVLAFHL